MKLMNKAFPESTGQKGLNELLVWKRTSEKESEPAEYVRVPTSTCSNYEKGQPFCAAGKVYASFDQLRAKGEERIWKRDRWGFHEMIGEFRDIYDRKVLYFSIRFPAYDIYDKMYDDRFERYYFLCEDERLTKIYYADNWDGFMVTEDVEKLDWQIWERLKEQNWIIW